MTAATVATTSAAARRGQRRVSRGSMPAIWSERGTFASGVLQMQNGSPRRRLRGGLEFPIALGSPQHSEIQHDLRSVRRVLQADTSVRSQCTLRSPCGKGNGHCTGQTSSNEQRIQMLKVAWPGSRRYPDRTTVPGRIPSGTSSSIFHDATGVTGRASLYVSARHRVKFMAPACDCRDALCS